MGLLIRAGILKDSSARARRLHPAAAGKEGRGMPHGMPLSCILRMENKKKPGSPGGGKRRAGQMRAAAVEGCRSVNSDAGLVYRLPQEGRDVVLVLVILNE